MRKTLVFALSAMFVVFVSLIGLGWFVWSRAVSPTRTDLPLQSGQTATLQSAIKLMASRHLNADAQLAKHLMSRGIWRAAALGDVYLKDAEKAGDTPYAYTLSSGKHPSAIVLAPRFFTEATARGEAALMIHEMGHYRAYVLKGTSDEFDGYKTEYDKAKQLGLDEHDGLVYFGMLDGVEEYVVPRDKRYAQKPDVKAYMAQPDPGQ